MVANNVSVLCMCIIIIHECMYAVPLCHCAAMCTLHTALHVQRSETKINIGLMN